MVGISARARQVLSGCCLGWAVLAEPMASAHAEGMNNTSSAMPTSFQARCQTSLPPASVEITTEISPLSLVRELDVRQLAVRSDSLDPVLGLVSNRKRQIVRVEWSNDLRDASGLVCARPIVHITLKLDDHQLFVAREVPDGTCAYQDVITHEMRHVDANLAHLNLVSQQAKALIQAELGDRIYLGTLDAIAQQGQYDLQQRWLPRLKALMQTVRHEHAEIDNDDEIERASLACGGNLAAIARASLMPAATAAAGMPTADPLPTLRRRVTNRVAGRVDVMPPALTNVEPGSGHPI